MNFKSQEEDAVQYSPCHIVFVHECHNSLEICGKAQRESARRPKSDWWEIRGGGKISSAPKSRGPNSNALAYTEREMTT